MIVSPRVYCPAGIARPTHIAAEVPMALIDGKGPDVAHGGPGGGRIYGGAYIDGEPGWHCTAAGWSLHLGGCRPQHLARLQPHPRVVTWEQVDGVAEDDWWRVPVLLSPEWESTDARAAGDDPVLYVSALDRLWGGSGWEDPPELVDVQRRLLAMAHGIAVAGAARIPDQSTMVDLVVAVLAIGHHVSTAEVIVGGWLSQRLLLRVLMVACGIPRPAVVEG